IDPGELAKLTIRRTTDSDLDEPLDAQARQAYKRRVAELRDELDDARELQNQERVARLEEGIALISGQLSDSLGIGGRRRRAGSTAEQARINVTKNIARAIRQLEEVNKSLGLTLRS